MSTAAVSQWVQRVRDGGPQALRHRPPPGASRQRAAEQLTRLPALFRHGPEAYGFRGQVWPRKRVAEVRRVEWGVMYYPTHVGRLLKAIRWNPQKPRRQTILFIDESGFYPLPSVVRTYAPMGRTPILKEWCTLDHLSAISAMSPEGKLYFHSQDCTLNPADVVAFLDHLLREVPGRILIVWDGVPVHRS